jgi:soluble lytic murein transglycosylase-like protein
MSRLRLASLSLVALNAVSCGLLSLAPRALPPVSAPPPAEASAPVGAAASPGDPLVVSMGEHIARHPTGLTEYEVAELARTIVTEARRHELDPTLVLAVMRVESRYYNFAVSPVGAMGLMQVMPKTGEEIAAKLDIRWRGPRTLFDPIANVRMGVAYLKQLSERYGSLPTALAAYNWGPGRVDRRLRRGRPVPTGYPLLVKEAHGSTQLERSS